MHLAKTVRHSFHTTFSRWKIMLAPKSAPEILTLCDGVMG